MIPDSLLFQMSSFLPGFSGSDIIIASVFASVLVVYIRYIKERNPPQKPYKKSSSSELGEVPSVEDEDFESSCAQHLRKVLARAYLPENSPSHTYREIARYVPRSDPRLTLLHRLEESEYRSQRLTLGEREEIIKTLI